MKKIYIENYGCTSNRFDLEIILGLLNDNGFYKTNDLKLANFVLINTCGVKKNTEDKILHKLIFLKHFKKPILITGCLPRINFQMLKKTIPDFAAMLDPYSIDKIIDALKRIEKGEKGIIFFNNKPPSKLELQKIRLNKIVEIIIIAEGCKGFCSFCCTHFARRGLFSYPKELIIKSIKKALNEGVKEVWLTAQDTGAYGLDSGITLYKLLEEICKIEANFSVRVGMMEPKNILNETDKLVESYKFDKIYKFLHIPLQSGSNKILEIMGRQYEVDDFKEIISKFRKEIPSITIATDMICGFPSEDEKDFKKSLKIIQEIKPDIVNISKFSVRPKTLASSMKKLPSNIIKERSTIMNELSKKISLEKNNIWLNWFGEVLIDEEGKKKGTWVGRNFAYKPIVIQSQEYLFGKMIKVIVTNIASTYLKGSLIK